MIQALQGTIWAIRETDKIQSKQGRSNLNKEARMCSNGNIRTPLQSRQFFRLLIADNSLVQCFYGLLAID